MGIENWAAENLNSSPRSATDPLRGLGSVSVL